MPGDMHHRLSRNVSLNNAAHGHILPAGLSDPDAVRAFCNTSLGYGATGTLPYPFNTRPMRLSVFRQRLSLDQVAGDLLPGDSVPEPVS